MLDGLERDIPLVMAKAILTLMDGGADQAVEPFRIGLEFGTRYRDAGWGQGLTILTCMVNLLPRLAPEDLILPVFLLDGHGRCEDVASMPGVQRRSLDGGGAGRLLQRIVELLGAPAKL